MRARLPFLCATPALLLAGCADDPQRPPLLEDPYGLVDDADTDSETAADVGSDVVEPTPVVDPWDPPESGLDPRRVYLLAKNGDCFDLIDVYRPETRYVVRFGSPFERAKVHPADGSLMFTVGRYSYWHDVHLTSCPSDPTADAFIECPTTIPSYMMRPETGECVALSDYLDLYVGYGGYLLVSDILADNVTCVLTPDGELLPVEPQIIGSPPIRAVDDGFLVLIDREEQLVLMGYGGAVSVKRTITGYMRSGASHCVIDGAGILVCITPNGVSWFGKSSGGTIVLDASAYTASSENRLVTGL